MIEPLPHAFTPPFAAVVGAADNHGGTSTTKSMDLFSRIIRLGKRTLVSFTGASLIAENNAADSERPIARSHHHLPSQTGDHRHSALLGTCRTSRLGIFALLALVVGMTGCVSSSPSQYVSPRVTGRVLDAQTQQPIKGVHVQRLSPDQNVDASQTLKGGHIIAQAPAVRTGSDGRFALDSEQDLALFRTLDWNSVSISFDHSGYERFVTNYTLIDAIVTPKGEPLVKAGDIRLQPKSN